MAFQAGYAQATITPALDRPVYLAGFGRDRRAVAVHDELSARALALRLGDTTVVVVALDLIGLLRRDVQQISAHVQRVAPGVQVLIACTHTHHGPDTIGLWGPDTATSGVDPAYMAQLRASIVATVQAALDALQPATMRSAAVFVPGVAKNARDPHILDEELTCLQFAGAEGGAPLASWLIFPCHPEVLWNDNPHITADYCFGMRRYVGEMTGAPCLAMVGALGGMMTPDMGGHTFDDATRMGYTLGQAALRALDERPARAVATLDYRVHEYTVPLENPLFDMAIEAGLLPDLRTSSGAVRTQAGLLRLDDTWLFSTPGEVLPELGLEFKAMLRRAGARNAVVIGLADDELGYILPDDTFVPPRDYLNPGVSYEESMSIGPSSGSRLTAALAVLMA